MAEQQQQLNEKWEWKVTADPPPPGKCSSLSGLADKIGRWERYKVVNSYNFIFLRKALILAFYVNLPILSIDN